MRTRVRVPWPAFPTCKSNQNGKGARTLGSTLLNINIFGLERWLIHDFEKVISCPKISHSQCLFLVPNVLALLNQTSAKLPNDRECVSCRGQGNVPLSLIFCFIYLKTDLNELFTLRGSTLTMFMLMFDLYKLASFPNKNQDITFFKLTSNI